MSPSGITRGQVFDHRKNSFPKRRCTQDPGTLSSEERGTVPRFSVTKFRNFRQCDRAHQTLDRLITITIINNDQDPQVETGQRLRRDGTVGIGYGSKRLESPFQPESTSVSRLLAADQLAEKSVEGIRCTLQ